MECVKMKYVEIRNDNNILQVSDSYQNMVLKKIIGFHTTNRIDATSNPHATYPLYTGAFWTKYPNGKDARWWWANVKIDSDINEEHLFYVVETSVPIADIQISEDSYNPQNKKYDARHLQVQIEFKDESLKYQGHKYIKIYVYTNIIKHKGDNGMEVLNDKGEVVFNSNYRYLQVKDVIAKHYDEGDKEYAFPAYQYPSIDKMAVAVVSVASSEGNYAHIQRINIDGKSIYGTYQKLGRGNSYSYIPEQSTIILVADVGNCSDIPISYDNVI